MFSGLPGKGNSQLGKQKKMQVEESMTTNILICGIGGQGTVLAAKLLDQAAINAGLTVHSAETIGMAQRGGSVTSHVRIGESWSPLIPFGTADMIIAFEMCEAVRNIDYLKKGGTVVVNKKIVTPVSSILEGKAFDQEGMLGYLEKVAGKVVAVDSESICRELGSSKIVNTILLGAAIKEGINGISVKNVEDAVKTSVKEKFVELNLKALNCL